MKIYFHYKDYSMEIVPLEIKFYQKINQAGQLYIAVLNHIESPQTVSVSGIFQGHFVFENVSEYKVMYFANKFDVQSFNDLLYYDAYANKFTQCDDSCVLLNDVHTITHNVKHLPYECIEIQSDSVSSDVNMEIGTPFSLAEQVFLRSRMLDGMASTNRIQAVYHGTGMLKKTLKISKFDHSVVCLHMAELLSNQEVCVVCSLNTELRIGNTFRCSGIVFTIVSLEHYITFSDKHTVVHGRNRPKHISLSGIQQKDISGGVEFRQLTEQGVGFVVTPIVVQFQCKVLVESYV